jgi:hypothetical protein
VLRRVRAYHRRRTSYLGIRHTVGQVTLEEPEDILFTDVYQPAGVSAAGDEEAAAARLA